MSLPNSLLRLWVARLASKIAICSAMTYDLYQLSKARGKDGSMKLAVGDDMRRQLRVDARRERERGKRTVQDGFVEGLVAAGWCRGCALGRMVGRERGAQGDEGYGRPAKRVRSPPNVRHFTTFGPRRQTAAVAPLPEPPEITREEYKELVNTYDSPSDLWEVFHHNTPRRSPTSTPTSPEKDIPHLPLAPRLVITPEQEDKPPYKPRVVLKPEDPEHRASLRHFRSLLVRDLGRISLTRLWETYQSLPAPRLRYVTDIDIRRLFRHLSWVEFRSTPSAMPRYFALLDECVAEEILLEAWEWNSAIAFAGRWVRYTTSEEVRGAVETWMRMARGGKEADSVTFHILFDVAVRAGRFGLADTIFHELKARGMESNRYFRTSMIYYAGMRGDGDAVRRTFRDLVNAGEIVDTVVMNCVILSLIRAGEHAAAENVFARMKRLVEQGLGTAAPGGWRQGRHTGRHLHRVAAELRAERLQHAKTFFGANSHPQFAGELDERTEVVQRRTTIAPDARTYRILIRYHAYTTGNFERIRELLAEMESRGLHRYGGLYTHILRGFWRHGGQAYTGWNWKALQGIWEEFLAATDQTPASSPSSDAGGGNDGYEAEVSEEDRAPYFTRALAHAAIRAWYKCVGRKKMLEGWEEIRDRWKEMSGDDRVVLQGLVEKLMGEGSVYAE